MDHDLIQLIEKYKIVNEEQDGITPQLHLQEETFLKKYNTELLLREENKFFNFIAIQHQLLYLHLLKAKEKIQQTTQMRYKALERLTNNRYKSQFQAIMDIIVSNEDLIISHYIIKWLNEINSIKFNNKAFKNEKSFTYLSSSTEQNNFIPDFYHGHKNPSIKQDYNTMNKSEYDSHLKKISNLLLQGNILEAQRLSASINLLNVNIFLKSCVPRHNTKLESKLDIDYDLIPFFAMSEETNKLDREVSDFGNSNWDLIINSKLRYISKIENESMQIILSLLSGFNLNVLRIYSEM